MPKYGGKITKMQVRNAKLQGKVPKCKGKTYHKQESHDENKQQITQKKKCKQFKKREKNRSSSILPEINKSGKLKLGIALSGEWSKLIEMGVARGDGGAAGSEGLWKGNCCSVEGQKGR